MAVRRFTQADADWILCGIGGVAAMNLGACTIVVLKKKLMLDAEFLPMVCGEIFGSATRRAFVTNSTNELSGELGGFSIDTPVTFTVADDWAVVAMAKSAGVTTLRGHKGILGGAWTHTDGVLDAADDDNPEFTDPLTNVRIGRHDDSNSDDNGLYAVVGIWLRKLSDIELETGLRDTLHAWRDLGPDFIVALNQASSATALIDLSGNGGNQSAIQGTSVVTTDDPPGFKFDGTLLDGRAQSTWNSTTGLTLFGADENPGKRLIIVGVDRGGGQTVTLSGTDAALVAALGAPIVQRVTDPTNSANRRSIWMWSCIIPGGTAPNPIVACDIRDAGNVEIEGSAVAWVVDIDASYELAGVSSADSGASTVVSQVTGTTPQITAGDHVVAAASVVRGDGTTDWVTTEDEVHAGQYILEITQGTGAGQRHAVGGHAFLPGELAQTYQDTLNLGTARMVSSVIAVFSSGGSGTTPVDLSTGVMTFTPVPLVPVPQPVVIDLSPATLTFAPVATTPVPGAVVIDLSPATLTFTAVPVAPLSGASVMLAPGVLTLQPVPLTYQPGLVTMDLSPGILTFQPVAIGQLGAEVDLNVAIGQSRIGSMLVVQSRSDGMSVGQTREARGN